MDWKSRKIWYRLVAATFAVVLAWAAQALADEVVSKGTRLQGKVKGVSSKGLTFESDYGIGTIEMKWEDVEEVTTDGSLQVLYGEEEELDAPIRGKRGTAIVVGEQEVETATIFTGVSISDAGPSWQDRLRSSWRYWDGNFDLGFNYQQSTTNTTGLTVAFATTRKKGRTRLSIGAGYRYSTEKKQGQSSSTIQDELKGIIRGEYDITDRWYGFASVDGEYDGIERLSIRTVPKGGVGYTIWQEDLDDKRQNFLKAEAGIGWVYQRYFGGVDDNYFTVAFGALATYYLPYDSKFDWRFDYLPAVDDWANNYLLRNTASLTIPMFDPISAKFSLMDEYNNKPAAGAAHNSLYITIGFSLAW